MSSLLVAWSPIQWGKPHGLMSISCKEMFERWCRSVGVDLFDLLLASARHPWYSLLPKYCATLIYCHSDKVWLREIRLPMSWVVGCLGWFLFYIRCWDWDWGSFASAALCVIACYSLLRAACRKVPARLCSCDNALDPCHPSECRYQHIVKCRVPDHWCLAVINSYCINYSRPFHLVNFEMPTDIRNFSAFLSEVTNNFAEIKSTVFKRYEEKSLFPIITSDIVERFYLLLDIIFVLARLQPDESGGGKVWPWNMVMFIGIFRTWGLSENVWTCLKPL